MRKCIVCEGLLSESYFTGDNPICDACAHRLQVREEIRYTEEVQNTVVQAHINLILAVRKQAESDGEIEDWRDYWLATDPWPTIWSFIYENYMIGTTNFSFTGGNSGD